MSVLEETFEKTKNIEHNFEKKRVLFIGSESYDGATITVIEGLHTLGFEILTFKKENINSWFCNKIIHDLSQIEDTIDFVLSNLHWGTRWSIYNNLQHSVPYILIDGDDRLHESNVSDYKVKYQKYLKVFRSGVSETLKNQILSPCRWIEPMPENYHPDVVFMSQKYKINTNAIYLPFGINSTYLTESSLKKTVHDRDIDICHIPGPGEYRNRMVQFVDGKAFKNRNVWNRKVYGEMSVDDKIKNKCEEDKNIHSWHRWRVCKDYHNTLMNSKISIISLIDKYNAPGWESKRVYEALSFGSYVVFQKQPDFDNSSYPIEEIGDGVLITYEDYNEMADKCNDLLDNQVVLEEKRVECYKKAMKYFTPEPITRYFLWHCWLFQKNAGKK